MLYPILFLFVCLIAVYFILRIRRNTPREVTPREFPPSPQVLRATQSRTRPQSATQSPPATHRSENDFDIEDALILTEIYEEESARRELSTSIGEDFSGGGGSFGGAGAGESWDSSSSDSGGFDSGGFDD